MRVSTSILSLLTLPFASAFYRGVNVGANNPDGSCKTQQDWENAFNTLAALPPNFKSFRLFASSDCNTLANAVPAAIATGSNILVGVWTADDTHFGNEKAALENAINQYGHDWILAISVGSEVGYRKELPAWRMAQQIYDVRGMVRAMGVNAPVGAVDTWTTWVDGSYADVITAVDFVGNDAYPYWQGATPDQASSVFWDSVNAVRNAVNAVKPGTPVWVTETGWPVSGDNFGNSVSSIQNAQQYWTSVGCPALQQIDLFWYAYQDYTSNPSFGIIGQNGQPLYNFAC